MRLGSPSSLVGLLPALGLMAGCAMSTDDAEVIGAEHGPALYGEAEDAAGTLVVDLRDGTSLAEARAHKGLSLIEVPQDPNYLAPGKQITAT